MSNRSLQSNRPHQLSRSLQYTLAMGLLFLAACSSSSAKETDAGTNAGTDTGGDVMTSVPFMGVAPCPMEADFTGGATVTFPNADLSYSPKCLKVAVGDTVTFMTTDGDFSMHPLEASRRRGDAANNPITTTQTAVTSREFTFSVSGFYGYYCSLHGGSDNGTGMAGVVWVQ